MKGLVIKNTGSWYTVRTDDGQTIESKIKGRFRLKDIASTNPVAVGDRVTILPNAEGTALITDIEERRNYIIRRSSNLSRQCHIIAANVDQAVLVVTVAHPETNTTFIDRFLASAEAYRVPVVLLFNKTDLLTPDEQHLQQLMVSLYTSIGYTCLQASALNGQGIPQLQELLQERITVFSGNSGVGKSTLLNTLVPGLNLRTAEISEAHDTGMHTTTHSEMIEVPPPTPPKEGSCNTASLLAKDACRIEHPQKRNDANARRIGASPLGGDGRGVSWLIDTPGIKGFGSFDMQPEEITSYFPEIFQYACDCRFSNCLHTHEPGCAVLQALENHLIAPSRYQSYLSMLEDHDQAKYREAF